MPRRNSTVEIKDGKVVFSEEVLNYFEDLRTEENSEWIDKYFNILSDISNMNSSKYRKHHIIPCFSFKDETHKNRKETLPLANNIEGNLIKLSISNHIKAHECLWKIYNNWNSKQAIQQLCQIENIEDLTFEEINEIARIKEEYSKENLTDEELKEHKRNYNKSEKGKKAHKKYRKSEKYKTKTNRYRKSEKGKKAIRKYMKSEKGKESMKKSQLKWRSTEKGKESTRNSSKKYRNSEHGKSVINSYIKSERGRQKIKEWKNSEKGKECIKKSQLKYCQSDKGKETRMRSTLKYRKTDKYKETCKEYRSQSCYDPKEHDFCTLSALYGRKFKHKEKYKDVIPTQCIIQTSTPST